MSKNKTNFECGNAELDYVFTDWGNDRERIKHTTLKYKSVSITEAFKDVYGDSVTVEMTKELSKKVNRVVNLEIGKVYSGTVKNIDKYGVEFEVSGVKDEIRCKETITDDMDAFNNYLLNHNNTLFFEVREINKGKIIVSVLNGYYKKWVESIEECTKHEQPIDVTIDSLVTGGYVCHCNIEPLCKLTGKEYTHSVFIPGSQIVLNIENDFEKWIGQSVQIIPQNFVKFRNVGQLIENSLVGSRKKLLQNIGTQNLYNIWTTYQLQNKQGVKVVAEDMYGVVTGIINSNKKQGAFIELNDKYITGLLPTKDYIHFHAGDTVKVRIREFETQEGKQAFEFNKKGRIKRCNTRAVFELA